MNLVPSKNHRHFFLPIILAACLFSCKKEENVTPDPDQPINVSPGDYATVVISSKTYATVKIGGRTWTALNYAGPGGIESDAKPSYGKYYTFDEAMAVQLPAGWRLPSDDDFHHLMHTQKIVYENGAATNTALIKRLIAKQDWANIVGNNLSGFNAEPAGYVVETSPVEQGSLAEFWTSGKKTFSLHKGADPSTLRIRFIHAGFSNTDKFNIRFVKDN